MALAGYTGTPHAPDRNPCSVSFAVVDRRLTPEQTDKVLSLSFDYPVESYEFNKDDRRVYLILHPDYTYFDSPGQSMAVGPDGHTYTLD